MTTTQSYIRPLVTIAIPTYNRSWGLRDALASAVIQSYRPIEIVVSDDASPDDTADVVKEFCADDVTYHRQPVNVGMVSNWGYGILNGNGDYVVILSDDDLLYPRFVEDGVNAFASQPDAAVALCRYEHHTINGTMLSRQGDLGDDPRTLVPADLLNEAITRRWWVGNSLYRMDAVRKVWPSIRNDDLVLDLGLNLRLAIRELGGGVYVPNINMAARIHGGQNSQTKTLLANVQAFDTVRRVLDTETCMPAQRKMLRRELAARSATLAVMRFKAGQKFGALKDLAAAMAIDPFTSEYLRRFVGALRTPRRPA